MKVIGKPLDTEDPCIRPMRRLVSKSWFRSASQSTDPPAHEPEPCHHNSDHVLARHPHVSVSLIQQGFSPAIDDGFPPTLGPVRLQSVVEHRACDEYRGVVPGKLETPAQIGLLAALQPPRSTSIRGRIHRPVRTMTGESRGCPRRRRAKAHGSVQLTTKDCSSWVPRIQLLHVLPAAHELLGFESLRHRGDIPLGYYVVGVDE